MKTVRRIILGLSALMGVWVIGSFLGAMFNPGNAEFWTTSLMWSLLACVLVMPGLVIAHHANKTAAQKARRQEVTPPTPIPEEQPSFIQEEHLEDAEWPFAAEEQPVDQS